MSFKPALATTKVTLAATSYIRFASKIEGQRSIDIASSQSGRFHKLHVTEGMQVKQGQALVEVYSPELVGDYGSTQAKLQQTCVTLATEQLRLSSHEKLYDKKIIPLQKLETLYSNVNALEPQVCSALALATLGTDYDRWTPIFNLTHSSCGSVLC